MFCIKIHYHNCLLKKKKGGGRREAVDELNIISCQVVPQPKSNDMFFIQNSDLKYTFLFFSVVITVLEKDKST